MDNSVVVILSLNDEDLSIAAIGWHKSKEFVVLLFEAMPECGIVKERDLLASMKYVSVPRTKKGTKTCCSRNVDNLFVKKCEFS